MIHSNAKPSSAIRLLSLLCDIVFVHVALVSAIWIHATASHTTPHWDSMWELIYGLSPLGIPFIFPYTLIVPLVIFPTSGLYNIRLAKSSVESFYPVIHSVLLSFLILAFAIHMHRADELIHKFSTSALLLAMILAQFGLIGWRVAVRTSLRMQDRMLKEQINLLIVGLSGLDEETFNRITANDYPNYNIAGYLEGAERQSFEFTGHIKQLGQLEDFILISEEEYIEEVLVVPSALSYSEFLNVVKVCELRRIEYRILPSYFDMVASRAQINLVNYVPLIHFGHPTISGWASFVKRCFDLAGSVVGLILLMPLFIAISILILLDSKGSPLFTQERVGLGGKPFRVYKFRSMVVGSERRGELTVDGDPRITKVGGMLRRWSLDELPQLLNVLIGDMSIVGPRAVVPFVVEKFNDLERLTLNILPGITGLAQVSGRDAVSFRDKSMLNIYYIRNHSFLLDMKIILKTIRTIATGEGNL